MCCVKSLIGEYDLIKRLYVKEYLSFEEAVLEFQKGLVVFTGPSGAGKSLLMRALLALLGFITPQAKVSEIIVDMKLPLENFGIQIDEEIVIRALKKEKSRFFINNQTVSKKLLQEIFRSKISYLNQKDFAFFASENIIALLDRWLGKEHQQKIEEYQKAFSEYERIKKELQKLEEKEQRSLELKEFLEFEIGKIEQIDPKVGEYEELLEIKKSLSQKEKIVQSIQEAEGIFEYESKVAQALALMEEDSAFFDEAMTQLRELFFSHEQKLRELEVVDIEEILDRIEKLAYLRRRYGSIEEALKVKEQKRKELEALEHLNSTKEALQKEREALRYKLEDMAKKISKSRKEGGQKLLQKVNEYVKQLKLPRTSIEFHQKELTPLGVDIAEVRLDGVAFKDISSGEYNRLRLAFLAAAKEGEGVLILDEIDANISGEESMAVAKILKELAKNYQIFAISHQAQLASVANQHFVVKKEGKRSKVEQLEGAQRVEEIARIISGERITQEAKEFAKKMLKEAS